MAFWDATYARFDIAVVSVLTSPGAGHMVTLCVNKIRVLFSDKWEDALLPVAARLLN